MKVYLYAKSGQDIGLDAIRRCSTIIKLLEKKNCHPILCVCDFKAGSYAKSILGVKDYISVETPNKLSKILNKGDILIYDSFEVSDFIENHMKGFCTALYRIPQDIPKTIVDKTLFTKQKTPKRDKAFFFGDDDHSKLLLNMSEIEKKHDISLLLGHYFFLGHEQRMEHAFKEFIEEKQYINVIKETKHLLSGSTNACLESIACGHKPILLKRADKQYDEDLIKSLHLPTIKANNLDEIFTKFEKTINSYPKLNKFDNFDIERIVNDIAVRVETFRRLSN